VKDAFQDFVGTTLGGLETEWSKIRYCGGLKRAGYRHWGLARTYGELPSQHAIATAHLDVFHTVLGGSLEELENQLLAAADVEGRPADEIIALVRACDPLAAGAAETMNYEVILECLSALREAAKPVKAVSR
jgi:hypothetical protein